MYATTAARPRQDQRIDLEHLSNRTIGCEVVPLGDASMKNRVSMIVALGLAAACAAPTFAADKVPTTKAACEKAHKKRGPPFSYASSREIAALEPWPNDCALACGNSRPAFLLTRAG